MHAQFQGQEGSVTMPYRTHPPPDGSWTNFTEHGGDGKYDRLPTEGDRTPCPEEERAHKDPPRRWHWADPPEWYGNTNRRRTNAA